MTLLLKVSVELYFLIVFSTLGFLCVGELVGFDGRYFFVELIFFMHLKKIFV